MVSGIPLSCALEPYCRIPCVFAVFRGQGYTEDLRNSAAFQVLPNRSLKFEVKQNGDTSGLKVSPSIFGRKGSVMDPYLGPNIEV